MYKFAKMNNEERDFVFNNVAIKKGIHKALVEKDFWICLVLDYLFAKSKFKSNIAFKEKFYRDNWAKYDDCRIGKFKLIPPDFRIPELRKDYMAMREMLYGIIPDFDDIILSLQELENEINKKL